MDQFTTLDSFIASQYGYDLPWMMTYPEKLALTALLSLLQPPISIEIGTAGGGSLQPIAKYSQHVYSLDIDGRPGELLKDRFSNVTFLTGDSRNTLVSVLESIDRSGLELGFVLVDGGHDEESVRTDINILLRIAPKRSLFILMHDSFNPSVRGAIRSADWDTNPHVHFLELDFVHGAAITHSPGYYKQLWGGFALAVLAPELRKGAVKREQLHEFMFRSMLQMSAHNTSHYATELLGI